jgi:hypothetical protein
VAIPQVVAPAEAPRVEVCAECRAEITGPNRKLGVCKGCWKAGRGVAGEIRRAYYRARYENEREKSADRSRQRRYGLAPGGFARMLVEQGGVCKVCGSDEPSIHRNGRKSFHTDHNHGTGVVRGILCGPCNYGVAALDRMLRNGAKQADLFRLALYAMNDGKIDLPPSALENMALHKELSAMTARLEERLARPLAERVVAASGGSH